MIGLMKIKINCLNSRLIINNLIDNGVYLKNIKEKSKSISFEMLEKDEKKLKSVCERFHKKYEIISRNNFVNLIKKLKYCFGFLLAFVLSFSFIFSFNLYVYDINILTMEDKNFNREKIELFLKNRGIVSGIKKSDIDTLSLENAILTTFEDVSSCLIKMNGGRLDVILYPAILKGDISKENIYSKYNAIVTSVDVKAGNLCVKVGDFVKEGDLLIQNDNGASGEIVGKTYFSDYLIYNENQQIKEYTGNYIEKKYFEIFKKECFKSKQNINFLNYSEENCVYFISKYNFIPLRFVKAKYKEFYYKDVCVKFSEREFDLKQKLYDDILKKLDKNFVDKITNVTYSIINEGSLTRLDCFVECEIDLISG